MNKAKKKVTNFEDLLGESLRFHGMLTPPASDETTSNVSLPEHLKEPDFLFQENKEIKESDLPRMRLAAFSSGKRKKKK